MSAPLRGDILLSRQASGLPRFSQAALASARARCAGPFVVPPHFKAVSEPLRAASPVLAPRRLGRPACAGLPRASARGSLSLRQRPARLGPLSPPATSGGLRSRESFVVGRDLGPSLPGPLSAPIFLAIGTGNKALRESGWVRAIVLGWSTNPRAAIVRQPPDHSDLAPQSATEHRPTACALSMWPTGRKRGDRGKFRTAEDAGR